MRNRFLIPTMLLASYAMAMVTGQCQAPRPILRVVDGQSLQIATEAGFVYQLQTTQSLSGEIVWKDGDSLRGLEQSGILEWFFSPNQASEYYRVVARPTPMGGGVTAEQSERLVLENVIQPDSLVSLVLGLRWPTTLKAGDVITPLSQPGDGDPIERVVAAESFFFVIDRAPSQKVGHPFDWVLVDVDSGAITIHKSFYPPEVGTVSPFVTLGQRWRESPRFYPKTFDGQEPPLANFLQLEIPPVEDDFDPQIVGFIAARASEIRVFAQAPTGSSVATSTIDCSKTPGRKVAVVVASGADDEIQNDARDMNALLTNLGFTVTSFNSKNDTVGTVQSGIQTAAQGLGPCDKFFIYISSHTELVDDNDDNKPDQTPIRLDYGLGHENKSKWSIYPRHRPDVSLTTGLQNIKAGRVNIMLDTCFSESMAVLIRRFKVQPPPGVEWNIFASSSATKTSGGASELDLWLDYENDDVNSQYTERILDGVNKARTANTIDTNGDGTISIDEIEAAFLAAHFAAEDGLSDAQMPQFDRFIGPLPTVTSDTFTVPSTHSRTVAPSDNDIKVGGVKYVLVDPPQLHSDLWSWNEATGQMTITGLTGMTGITFTYKAVVDSYETRPILTQINFDPALNINPEVLTDPNDANKKSVNVNCLKLGNLTYPVYQFRLTNNPLDSCKEPHWHSFGNVYAIDVNDNTGRPDPNPPGCGHGISKDVPQLIFTIDLDTWEQFKIDHLPPL